MKTFVVVVGLLACAQGLAVEKEGIQSSLHQDVEDTKKGIQTASLVSAQSNATQPTDFPAIGPAVDRVFEAFTKMKTKLREELGQEGMKEWGQANKVKVSDEDAKASKAAADAAEARRKQMEEASKYNAMDAAGAKAALASTKQQNEMLEGQLKTYVEAAANRKVATEDAIAKLAQLTLALSDKNMNVAAMAKAAHEAALALAEAQK